MNALSDELELRRARSGIPAVSLAVYRQGRPLFAQAWGLADPPSQAATTAATRFRAGCLTKPVVAVAVLRLAADGRLRLSDPVATYLPALARSAAPGLGDVTLTHLLAHHGGLPRGTYFERSPAAADLLAEIAETGCVFAPGTTYKYSNWGYFLLGETIARAAGRPAHEVIRDTVLQPLGMHDTAFETGDGPVPGLAIGHWHHWHFGFPDQAAPLAPCPLLPLPPCASGLVSTAADFARFLNTIEHDDRCRETTFWPRPVIAGLIDTVFRKSADKSVSLGLFREGAGASARWYFPGTSSGFSAFMAYLPRHGVVGIGMANRLTCNHELDGMLASVVRETCPDVELPPSPRRSRPYAGDFVGADGEPAALTLDPAQGPQLAFRGQRIPLYAHSHNSFYPLDGPDREHMLRLHARDGRVSSLSWGRLHFRAAGRERTQPAADDRRLDAFAGVYQYPGFGRAEVIHRNARLYLNYGVVYETPLLPAGERIFVQERGPCHGETIRFRAPKRDCDPCPSFVMNGMEFRKLPPPANPR